MIVEERYLPHEQGHLDINELYAEAFRTADLPQGTGLEASAASDDLTSKLNALLDKYMKEAQFEQRRYDKETRHGQDSDRQGEWNLNLRKRMTDAHIVYWNTPQRVLPQVLLFAHEM
jgi:hypothetical protein